VHLKFCQLFSWPGLKGRMRIRFRNNLNRRMRIRTKSFQIQSTESSVADPVPFLTRDPGWVKNQDPDLGSGAVMTIFGSYFRELRNNFLG
jgi:hypothetical protein